MLGKISSIVIILGTNLSYGTLLFLYTSYNINTPFYLSISAVVLVFGLALRISKYGKSGRKIDHELEAPEELIIVDKEAKGFLINKNSKGMVTKLGKFVSSFTY